jgi:two-component system cell cycle sensor histidine kinase/response regulator CckA
VDRTRSEAARVTSGWTEAAWARFAGGLPILALITAPLALALAARGVGASGALAAGVGGAFGAALWGLTLRRSSEADAAFEALYADGASLGALTDADGRLMRCSDALSALLDRDEATAAEALSRFSAEPDALAYRLIVGARERHRARETIASDGAPLTVEARRLPGDRLMWSIEPGAGTAAEPGATFAPDAFIDTLPVALTRLSAEGVIVFANAAARALLGPSARTGARVAEVIEGLGRSMEVRIAEALRGDSSGRPEIARGLNQQREVFLQVSLTLTHVDGAPQIVMVMSDATELKTLEAQFVQSQKMQAVGQLAGGVAHDFNNLLTAISGHTDLLLQRHDYGDLDFADLTQIKQNANRAAGLVRQLLAFSRKQTLRPTVVNLVDVLTETSHLLNRLLGERVTLRIEHEPDVGLVKVDERQFEQVVMNLAVNARDAMPKGGVVTIRTANVRIDAERRRGRAVMPKGDYVFVEVADQGVGIPEDKIDQIFEPFFTTKKAGEGTGLGLSTVYGIVKQTGGFIFAESEVGVGATFRIYLPRHEGEAPEATARKNPAPAGGGDLTGRGVILLIEDETPVRAFGARALKLRGYEVLEAATGEEALDILSDPALHVDAIVSDVVMPGLDGPSTVREARKLRPGVKVIFVSGYAEDALKKSIEDIEDCHFLPKPFSLNDLTAKVKECLSA